MTSKMIQRAELHSLLPLDTPLSVHIYPSYKCNFRCNYCVHALSTEELRQSGFIKEKMAMETFEKIVEGLICYPKRVKAVIFAGHGEPLTHKSIHLMVKQLKDANVAERVEITTNGTLLTREMTDNLVAAGLDRLKISIQGTTPEQYMRIAGYNIRYDEFLSNLSYLYKNKGSIEIYIKAIDTALTSEADHVHFRSLFAPVSDYLDIEYLIPFVQKIDHSALKTSFDKCKQGHTASSSICSMPFYMQVIAPNGDILPCCSVDIPLVVGNVNNIKLADAWQSTVLHRFQESMLLDREINPVCHGCSVPTHGLQPGDYLDDHRARLTEIYSCL